ncbi:hypothetical protein [Fictibacillus phosphorivorans]|uniref:hypothetical protein n=1 Tax=Fictibacillus phosphorivorans TaxID=1221500 RepID=UPI0012930909|nr:hypothetical protein [Fictibacillus phosphorivorans]
MDEDFRKVKQRIDKRLEEYDEQNQTNPPFNDAIDHFGKIEGYPTQNLSKVNMKGFPLPIRILGYFFLGTMGVGMIMVLLLTLFK